MEQQEFYHVPSFCRAHAISRTKAYEEIAAGRLEVIKIGKLTRISREGAQRWRERLAAETKARAVPAPGKAA